MDKLKIIVNRNTYLRPVTLEDAEEVFLLTDANRKHIGAFLPWVDDTKTVGDTRAFIASTSCDSVYNGVFALVICFQDKIVGMVDFHAGSIKNKTLEIGYWLGKEFAGQGIMTKACAGLIEYAFKNTDANRIVICCDTANFKSQAIPQRLGFIKEGIERQANVVRDRFVDINRNSMLRQEWINQRIADRLLEKIV